MNFREELAKIRRVNNLSRCWQTQYEKHAENILKEILRYYEKLESSSSNEAKEINFHIDKKNKIIVKILDLDEEDLSYYDYLFSYDFKSKKEAKNVLLFLRDKFKSESYQIMFGKSIEKYEEFSVLID